MFSFRAEGDEFIPPSSKDFVLPPIFGDNEFTTKPIFLVIFSVIIISIFFIAASRKASIVPSKLQFAGESVYAYVRNDLGKDIIGHEFMRFVPYLFTLFVFILTNNIFGIVPLIQFPTMSRISFAYVLGIITFGVFHYVGIRHHGIFKYIKDILRSKTISEVIYAELQDAHLRKLEAETAAEYANAAIQYNEERIKRLEARLTEHKEEA
jgi:F-type H+-transporting ATPase subunit a